MRSINLTQFRRGSLRLVKMFLLDAANYGQAADAWTCSWDGHSCVEQRSLSSIRLWTFLASRMENDRGKRCAKKEEKLRILQQFKFIT